MKKEVNFPVGFYWGAATASYQVEGDIYNTDWAKAAEEGKVPVASKAADHYHLYEKDFDIAKDLGHNAHRFSVEWARIEPTEGVFEETQLDHYRQVLHALRARNLEPLVTLWHFTLPLWFSESGGFERKDAPEIFARYCTRVVEAFGDLAVHYSTINEPIVYANNGWLRGQWPPFKRWKLFSFVKVTNTDSHKETSVNRQEKGSLRTFLYVTNQLVKAHVVAYKAIKSVNKNTDISIVRDVIVFAANKNLFNKFLALVMNWFWTHRFNNKLDGQIDSYGLNYYFYKKFGDKVVYKKTDMQWDSVPEGIYDAIKILERYQKPIYVAEAGIADQTDKSRADYITNQIKAVAKALNEGIDVRGHIYWSLLDNYEWALGFEKRFGLVAVDYNTMLRKVRSSAYVYKKIIQNNKITIDIKG